MNDDGFADIVIGAPPHPDSGGGPGAVYVVFGGPNVGRDGSVDVSKLDGKNGFILAGADDDRAGGAVGAGDLNGDGVADLVIGAPGPEKKANWKVYVVFGGPALGGHRVFRLPSVNGRNGFLVKGDVFSELSVSAGADLNADGIGDLVIGAPRARPNGTASGAVYVIYGKANGASKAPR